MISGATNLVFAHCWKEWRSQRAMLLAYSLLAFVSLSLVFLIVPEAWWQPRGQRALVLSWFVAAAVIGVVAFVAPALTRNEFVAQKDQFVRRLPRALGAAFAGKLLFLTVAAVALPLVGLLWGECFLDAVGRGYADLYDQRAGEVFVSWPWPTVWCAGAGLLMPLVWAIGIWLPGGRMAVGGTVLLLLVLAISIGSLLRLSPGIENGLAWQSWLVAVPLIGLLVAACSWLLGRRGGSPMRSMAYGVASFAIGMLPPGIWFAKATYDYHHPDPQHLARMHTIGLSPDGRYALIEGSEHEAFVTVPFRVDLVTGEAEQVSGIYAWFSSALARPWPARHGGRMRYRRHGVHSERWIYDLVTGERHPVAVDTDQRLLLTPEWQQRAMAQQRALATLSLPGSARVWLESNDGACELCIETAPDVVTREPLPSAPPRVYRPAGHGFTAIGEQERIFDLTHRVWRAVRFDHALLVRGELFFVPRGGRSGNWQRQRLGEAARPCRPLANASIIGLLDDDRLLCRQRFGAGVARLFVYDVVAGAPIEISQPAERHSWLRCLSPFSTSSSVLQRDPRGRLWFQLSDGSKGSTIWTLDPSDWRWHRVVDRETSWVDPYRFVDWLDADHALIQKDGRILRVHAETGERQQLFPRARTAR